MSSLFLSFVFIVCLYLLIISIKSKGLKRMTPVQLYEFLKTAIHANLNVLITSPPGCGKTAIVNQVCAEEQADLVPMFPAISDPTDFKGFPFIVSGNAVFLPFGDLKLLKEAKKRTICFLDDLGQASISVQAACFPSDTPVMCQLGLKNISDIIIGDSVLDQDGNIQKVTNVFNRAANDLVEISSVGILPIKCTSEHPILVMRSGRKRVYIKTDDGYKIDHTKYGQIEWARADSLNKNDYIALPIPKGFIEQDFIELNYNGHISKRITLTKEISKIIGYYVGDGSYTITQPRKENHNSYSVIAFSIDNKYPELHEDLINLIKTCFNTKVYTTKQRGCLRISFREQFFGDFLHKYAGDRSNNKRIPDFILYNKNIDILSGFLQGYLATDGGRLFSSNRLRGVQWTTVSKTLAYQLQIALARYGAIAPIKYRCRKDDIMVSPTTQKEYLCQDSYHIQCSDKRIIEMLNEPYDSKRTVVWSFEHDNKLWTKVKNVTKLNNKIIQNVYNLEVENSHTYTVNNIIVHNCMQLLHAKYNVSKHVSFFAATNRREDKAGVAGLLEPVKSRFSTIVSLEPNANDLANWGFKNNMHHDVLSFILYRPALVLDFKPVFEMKNSPCPRTIFNLSECHKLSLPEDQAFEVYKGAVGEGFATEFLGFLELKSQLPNMNTVLTDPSNAKIPTDPGILYVFIGQLAYRASQTNMTNIIKLANRIDPEFGMVLMTIIGQRSKKLLEHPEAVAYLSKINNAYA